MREEESENHVHDQTEAVGTSGLGDKRFEVKWRKKEGSSASDRSEQSNAVATEELTPDQLARELSQAREQIEQLRDRWQRSAADLANLRRRTEEEKGDVEKFANMLLVAELLPVLDNFERAISTIPGDLAMLTWIHGIILIERQLGVTLERQGLTEVEAEGKPFNPSLHEAIAEKETSEVPPGSVLRVYQKGYELGGRLIRPALVEIAKAEAISSGESVAQAVESANPVTDPDGQSTEEAVADAEAQNVGP